MALQSNNLMLLDENGFPRTIDGTTDSIGITTDLIIGGDLTVDGDIVSSGTMDVVVTDNFIDLSSGNITGAKSGGLTVQVKGVVARSQALNAGVGATKGVTFESQATTGGNARFKVDTIDFTTTPGAAGDRMSVNDIIQISGLSEAGENNGLFTVAKIDAGAGGWVEVKNANAATVPFCQTNFEDEGPEDLAASFVGWSLDIGVITISGGALPTGVGAGVIAIGNFATAFATDATDAAGVAAENFAYGDAASVSLQEAYDEGQTIELVDTKGDFVIKTDETGVVANFVVENEAGTFEYLATDATSDTLNLGAMNGINPAIKVKVLGEVSSDIMWDATKPYSIGNMTLAGGMDNLTVGGASLDLGSMDPAVGKRLTAFAQGVGDTASLTATNVYAGNASVAGDIEGTAFDVNGAGTALTVTFGATAADLAALIAGATVAPGGAVVLSDDGTGKLKFTSAAVGSRVSFNFDAESAGGVGNSIGFAGFPVAPAYASNGQPAVGLRAYNGAGDVEITAGRHIGLISMAGSLELRTQAGGQQIAINAQSGTLALSATTNAVLTSSGGVNISSTTAVDIDGQAVSIDGGLAGGGGSINIGTNKRVAIQIDALDLGLDATGAITIAADDNSSLSVAGADKTLTLQATGGGGAQQLIASSAGTGGDAIKITASAGGTEIKSTVGTSLLQGVGATLDSTGAGTALINSAADITLSAGTGAGAAQPAQSIQFKGWLQQDYTASAGMGIEVKVHSGVAAVVGQVFAFVDDGGAPANGTEAKAVGAADSEAPGVCGAYLEAIAVGLQCKASTVQGAVVMLDFQGGFPAIADVGAPVYLSATTGRASIAAPTAAGQHVIRLGFAHEAGSGRVLWAPQYIAKRP